MEQVVNTELPLGSRVRLRRGAGFMPLVTGEVADSPYLPNSTETGEWIGHRRRYRTPNGVAWAYWIVLESPAYDEYGYGPVWAAEILEKYLEPLEPKPR